MQKLIIVFIVSGLLAFACNDSNNTASEKDDTSIQQPADSASASTDNPGTQQDNSMMSSMMKHMDMMKNMSSMNDPDHDFAMMMKHHHTAATEMAQSEISQGQQEPVKSIARKMVSEQEKDIQQLDNFLKNNASEKKAGGDKFHHEMMQMMKDMPMDMSKTQENVDQQFTSLMIQHHEQGIHMANMYLPYAKNQEMKALANKIIKAQQTEIKELKDVQAKHH